MKTEIELDLSEFVGLQVIGVEGGSIQFDQGVLRVECAWRVRNQEGILVSEAEYKAERTREKARQISKQTLQGAKIKAITIYEVPCDISIEFDNQVCIDIIPLSAQFESWDLRRTNGRHLSGLPGGRVTWFLQEEE